MRNGLWYDDDEFLYRLEKITTVNQVVSKELVKIHQFHTGGSKENS